MKAKMLLPLVALLVLAAVSVGLGACGGSDDKDLFEKVATVWKNKDAEGAREIFAADANLYWNWSEPTGQPADMTRGIDEISTLVASGTMGYPTLYGDAVYALDIPADEDLQYISANYKGTRFIYCPIYTSARLFMLVLGVRDGKVQSQVVTPIEWD